MSTFRSMAWLLTGCIMTIGHPHAAARESQDVHVGILMFDGVQIIDFAGPYEVFGQAGFRVSTVSADGKPLTTAMGLRVVPDLAFAAAPEFDVVLVPGGNVHEIAQNETVQAWLRARAERAEVVLSVCTGTDILATSGLLERLTATTFHRAFDHLTQLAPNTRVVRDVRWVDNGKVITSAGLSSGIDAALHVVERLLGEDRARTVAMHLEYDWHPERGFVRGLMADRYMPPWSAVPWPEDFRFEQLAGYGDRTTWFQRFRIQGRTPPGDLLALIDAALDPLPGWDAERDGPGGLTLKGRPAAGVDVSLHLETSAPANDGGFVLTSRMQVAERVDVPVEAAKRR